MRKRIFKLKFYALAATILLLAVSLPVAAQHDMQNMPGMNMGGKSKGKPKAKAATVKRRPTRKRGKTSAGRMKGMSMPSSSPASSRTRRAAPQKMEMNMPGMTTPAQKSAPASSSEQMQMPGMQMPASTSSPSPQPSATPEKMEMNMPGMQMPATEQPKPEMQSMPGMQMGNPANQQTPAKNNESMPGMDMSGQGTKGEPAKQNPMPGMNMPGMNMPGMSGSGRISADDPRALLMMSGEMMDIRVGSKERNSLAMGQMGSGTSWQPTTTPMYMYTKVTDKWLVFIHGEAKIGINSQGGPRGVTKFESQNWIMPMAFRRWGKGTLQLRGMFSFEPLTFSPGGSPELFQTGESYKGEPLVDRQHPHDLFMELSATYTVPLGERATWFAYAGFPGEPALGPTAFMHRWSAAENPAAPLAHHLQDSTHISFGVVTTGFTYRWLKLEGSLFNGREPDENRYNFEFHPWNSRSVRLSLAPSENLSLQWSYGLLKDPEALNPGDVRRMTASLAYNKRFARGNWATSLIWGRNDESHAGEVETLNGYTMESTLNFLDKNYLYTRLELVDKVDLLSEEELKRAGIADHHAMFRVGAYTFGAARDIWNTKKFSVALGGDLTFYSKPEALDSVYGQNPVSTKFFIRIRPSRMTMKQ